MLISGNLQIWIGLILSSRNFHVYALWENMVYFTIESFIYHGAFKGK